MPGRAPYQNEVVKKWTAEIAAADGFIFVTPEYNFGPAAVLKNAIDWVYPEWNRKAVGFVSYGSAMGARSVQQLRQTAIELSVIKVFETASRANGGRLWLVWLMTLRGSPLVLQAA